VVKKKFPVPIGTRNPDHPARSSELYHCKGQEKHEQKSVNVTEKKK